MKFILTNLLGFILGSASSFFVWYYLFRKVVPKIKFSNSISQVERNGKPHYRIKFQNSGKRDIIDVGLTIKYRVRGLFPELPDNWKVVYISTNKENIPVLRSKMKGGVLANFYINKTEEFGEYPFPAEIKSSFNKGELTLHDILNIGETELNLMLMGYDEFSGSRRLFISKKYFTSDIVKMQFEVDSLNLKDFVPPTFELIDIPLEEEKNR